MGIFLELIQCKDCIPECTKKKENCLVFMFYIKRESWKFHVIIINDTLRGLQSPEGGFQDSGP